MNDFLKKAVELSERTGHCFVATVNSAGVPHLAVAKKIGFAGDDLVIADWFCPETVTNLTGRNNSISMAVWDPVSNSGFQLIGVVKKKQDLAMMDGYAPDQEAKNGLPQVRRSLTIRIDKIFDFRFGPHSDVERSTAA